MIQNIITVLNYEIEWKIIQTNKMDNEIKKKIKVK